MSTITGKITPQLRAAIEALCAKYAAPGINNPADKTATGAGTGTGAGQGAGPNGDGNGTGAGAGNGEQTGNGDGAGQGAGAGAGAGAGSGAGDDPQAARRDTRSPAQRNHDARQARLSQLLATGDLGTHRGLPVTVIVTTTITDLEAAAAHATGNPSPNPSPSPSPSPNPSPSPSPSPSPTGLTSTGTRLPISELLHYASFQRCYLVVFEDEKPKALYHTKRFASEFQRLVLHAGERGCTKPGCDTPAAHCEVHHVTGWTKTRRTDINDLTLACGPHNRLAENGWTTRKNSRGHTEWIPPPHLDTDQPRVNNFHHPERHFTREDAGNTGEDDDGETGQARQAGQTRQAGAAGACRKSRSDRPDRADQANRDN
ncbi:DUF222 domain-containing protein, partial [Mycobacterium sp.]|uniref:HNH endonuclease signature motif containing protein n=1 Tax=Mycobacterium sp. TaxID=1785 RepID=UPI003A8B3110